MRPGILMTGEIVMEARRQQEHNTVKDDGDERRGERASRSNAAGHHLDYVTIAA
jgi:hypothetical protein